MRHQWAHGSSRADARWLILTNALSGLFCASLNFVDSTRTIRPVLTFTSDVKDAGNSSANLHLLHGTLPNEVVCTENLTPFLKLLPCKGKAGVSSLLDGHKLFDASWQSMAIDVRPSFDAESNIEYIQLEQTIDMVLDIERSKRSKGVPKELFPLFHLLLPADNPEEDPIPRPLLLENMSCEQSKPYSKFGDSCYPSDNPSMPAFSISEVFGRSIKGACPLVGNGPEISTALCIDIHSERKAIPMTDAPFSESRLIGNIRCFNMPGKNLVPYAPPACLHLHSGG